MRHRLGDIRIAAGIAVVLWAGTATVARAHCDTMDGPVVTAAQRALATGNVNHALMWVRADDEAAIRRAFERARAVRQQGADARELADYWFFETLVRVHREGEGEPYTGLKPAGTEVHPGVEAADRALAAGKVDEVERVLLHAVRDGLHQRFQAALARKTFEVGDVAGARAYVHAYVPFLHYVERLFDLARESGDGHREPHQPSASSPRP
jgi:hypothetical protein